MDEYVRVAWHAASTCIESLQISSIFFSVRIPWSTNLFEEFFDDIVKLRLSLTGNIYIPLFLICVCAVLLFITLFILSIFCEFLDSCIECFWELFGDAIWFGILFVPMISLLLEIFRCDDGYLVSDRRVECWKGAHGGYCFLSILSLVVVLLVGAWKAGQMNSKAKRVCSKKNCQSKDCQHKPRLLRIAPHENYVETKYMVWRLIIIIMGLILESLSHNGQVGVGTLLVIVGLYPFLYFVGRVPHAVMGINYFKAAIHAGTWWTFVCCFVAILVEDPNNDASRILLGLWPVAIILGVLIAVWRTKVMTNCCDLELDHQDRSFILDWNKLSNSEHLKIRSKPFAFQSEDLVEAFDKEEAALTVIIQITDSKDVENFVQIIRDSRAEEQEVPVRGLTIEPNQTYTPLNSIAGSSLEPFYQLLREGHPSLLKLKSLSINGFKMKTDDVNSLLGPLKKNENLVELDLFNNTLGENACLEAVKSCKQFGGTFAKLILANNPISGPAKSQIEKICKDGNLKVDFF